MNINLNHSRHDQAGWVSISHQIVKFKGPKKPLEHHLESGGKIGKTRRKLNTDSSLLALFAFHIALHVAAHAMTMVTVMTMVAAMTSVVTTHLTAH